MARRYSIRIFLLLLVAIAILIPSCLKDQFAWKPEVLLVMKPDSGLTTQTFDFRVDIPNLPTNQQEFFLRWDMNADSAWDAAFTACPTLSYRFYQKGSHKIRMEFLTKDGKRLAFDKIIKVDQGYSAPHAAFTIDPPEGNYLTEFTFDASSTIDDEDAFSSLQFRWDFENNGIWDTELSASPIAKHKFSKSADYSVKLSVMDPTHRVATETKTLSVNLIDTLIKVDFTWLSKDGTVKDTFLLDAAGTHHLIDSSRVFSYSWDIKSEVVFGPFTDPKFLHVFWNAGMEKVTLTAKDQFGLSNSITKEFYVIKENKPPIPQIQVSTPYGNITTNFYLSAWPSLDDVTPPSRLLIRWDFDGDGNWDTGWSYDKTLFHQFSIPGEYWVALEAEDEGGERAVVKKRMLVSPYKNQTGYIQDKRDGNFYGIVKIGEQWWMSDNLDYRTNPKMDIPMLQRCYDEANGMCDLYGALYLGDRAVNYTESGKNICPDGWRIPSRSDWLKLGENIPKSGARDAMMVGGRLGFNARYTGYGTHYEPPSNPSVRFFGLYQEVQFLSITTRPFQSEYQAQFYMGIQRNFDGVNLMWGNLNGYFYARCLKNDQ